MTANNGDDLLPPRELAEIPDLDEIKQKLRNSRGREFEEVVCDAMNYLDLTASLTETTEAEADVIAEALHAEIEFFIVIECTASRDGAQVGVEKVGQIRGNASTYLDTRRQQLFEAYRKLVIGRPEFSNLAKERAAPDVGLMTADTLVRLLELHNRYQLSQNVLYEIFKEPGEIDEEKVNSIVTDSLRSIQYFRRLNIYSLIYLALLRNPFSDTTERRKKWTSIAQIIAEVITYGKMFRIGDLSTIEVALLIRDLDNPLLRIVESRGNEIRLGTISKEVIQNSSQIGQDLVYSINENFEKLQNIELK